METNILLESGTNELEILEFMIDKNYYGINVAVFFTNVYDRMQKKEQQRLRRL